MAYVIVQPGYASGDMFGIAAALIIDATSRVLITEPTALGEPNHAAALEGFYRQSGIHPNRIAVVRVSDLRAPSVTDKNNTNNAIKRLLGLGRYDRYGDAEKKGVTHGTDFVEGRKTTWVTGGDQSLVRAAWRLDPVPPMRDAFIRQWMLARGYLFKPQSRVVILWSRYSGKKGDIHVEHDTGKFGMTQLVERALRGNDFVFIAGDKPPLVHQKTRWSDLANAHRGKVFDLTEFWSNNDTYLQTWCPDRVGQMALYDYFHRHSAALKHLGFRSGNLEGLAMIGHDVRYLEEPYSEGSRRMEAWHHSAVGYDRIQLRDRVPTRSGQHVKRQMREAQLKGKDHYQLVRNSLVRPAWVPAKRAAGGVAVKPNLGGYTSGFTPRDLDAIEAYLNS